MTKKLGLALGSGADRGFAHIGIIKVLQQRNIAIDCLAGSSIGSIVAAYYALHQDIIGLEEIALQITKLDLLNLIDLNNPNISLIKGEKIKQFLKTKVFGEKTFSDLKLPLSVIATNLNDGTPYILKSGRLLDAIIASSSIPGVIPPFIVNNVPLVDGGISSAVPIETVRQLGAERIVGVDLYAYKNQPLVNLSTQSVLSTVYKLFISKLSSDTYKHQDQNTIILQPHTNEGPETITFSKIRENIEAGETEAINKINQIRLLFES